MITRHRTKGMLRGFPMYSSNGLSPTKHIVELNGDKIWRRIYIRYAKGRFIPVVKIKEVVTDLTSEDKKFVGYKNDSAWRN